MVADQNKQKMLNRNVGQRKAEASAFGSSIDTNSYFSLYLSTFEAPWGIVGEFVAE